MKSIRLPLHSIIDVITNSSTEIYTFATTESVQRAKDLINAILVAGSSDKRADDLFDVYLVPDDGVINREIEYLVDHTIPKCDQPERNTKAYYDFTRNLANQISARGYEFKHPKHKEPGVSDWEDIDEGKLWTLVIDPKSGVDTLETNVNLVNLLSSVLQSEAIDNH